MSWGFGMPVQITAQEGEGEVSLSWLDSILGTVDSMVDTGLAVDAAWGDINNANSDGVQSAPPQPTQGNLAGPEDLDEGISIMGIGGTALVAAVIAGFLTWYFGGNIAWVIIAAVATGLLAPYVLGM